MRPSQNIARPRRGMSLVELSIGIVITTMVVAHAVGPLVCRRRNMD